MGNIVVNVGLLAVLVVGPARRRMGDGDRMVEEGVDVPAVEGPAADVPAAEVGAEEPLRARPKSESLP